MIVAARQTTKYLKRDDADGSHQDEGLLKAKCGTTETSHSGQTKAPSDIASLQSGMLLAPPTHKRKELIDRS